MRARTLARSRAGHALLALVCACATALIALAGAAPAMAGAGAWWRITSSPAPSHLGAGEEGQLDIAVNNLGYEDIKASAEHPLTFTDTVPAGLEVLSGKVRAYDGVGGRNATLSCQAAEQTVTCAVPKTVPAYEGFEVLIPVAVSAQAGSSPTNSVAVAGGEGGAPEAHVTQPLALAGGTTGFGVERYELTPENEQGEADLQAGAHPFQLTTTLDFDQTLEATGKGEEETTPALVRDLHFVLPPGLLGNVTVTPQCTTLQFATIESGDLNQCAADTAVGVARIKLNEPAIYKGALTETVPVFNLVPAEGEPARFGIEIDKVPVILNTAVLSGSDYAVEVSTDNSTSAAALIDSQVTFWGVPGDSRHNASRGWECVGDGHWVASTEPHRNCVPPQEKEPPKAFLTLPTTCSQAPTTTVSGDSWPFGAHATVGSLAAEYTFPAALSGCATLAFEPQIEVKPEVSSASTPSGFTITISVPQTSTVSGAGVAEADINDTEVTLPEGVQASPGASDGLETCSSSNVGFLGVEEALQVENDDFSAEAVSCPASSKIGNVTIRTPLLAHELTGGVYLAAEDTGVDHVGEENLFKSPLVLYLMAEEPVTGVRVKLAGGVRINQANGQLTTIFKNTPPLPFEALTLHLFGGSRASQSTPALCGLHTTTATFKAFTAPTENELVRTDHPAFTISEGADGTPCQYSYPQSFAPTVQAGATDPQAGAYTSFSLAIEHSDADQPLSGLTVHLPEGLAATIANVTPCPEPAAGQAWSCGEGSLLGTALTTSGLGGDPVTLGGRVYLTQGYEGAPFGLLVATEAKAGPFDLGMVYVRSKIEVNPATAAVTITTAPGPHDDAFPTFIDGVPVQLKQIIVNVDRPDFEFNPTNCNVGEITATLNGSQGGVRNASYPFHVTNCSTLPFKPTLTATAAGQASKANGASLDVKITSAGLGQANIAKVDLQLPAALPSRLTTLQQACLEATFNANPASCDEGSVIGRATIHTPVLKNPLSGPAYLVSHGGAAFPDVEFVLQGEGITLVLDGKTDIKNGITYSRFESAPDAPFTTFETELPAGPHSALTAYVPKTPYDLCATTLAMPTEITAQNGAFIKDTTNIAVSGCGGVLGVKTTLTRAQLLAKALKACKKDRKKAKRQACEKLARKKYGAKKTAKKSSRRK